MVSKNSAKQSEVSSRSWVNPSVADGSLGGGIEFIRPSKLAEDHEEGTTKVVLEGIYEGQVDNPKNPAKKDFRFKKEDGTTAIINNSGNLGYKMSNVNLGDYCQIQYSGKKALSKGPFKGTLSHDFGVLIAAE